VGSAEQKGTTSFAARLAVSKQAPTVAISRLQSLSAKKANKQRKLMQSPRFVNQHVLCSCLIDAASSTVSSWFLCTTAVGSVISWIVIRGIAARFCDYRGQFVQNPFKRCIGKAQARGKLSRQLRGELTR
jgi:hypothetical protein